MRADHRYACCLAGTPDGGPERGRAEPGEHLLFKVAVFARHERRDDADGIAHYFKTELEAA